MTQKPNPSHDIAVIGMAGRFPGAPTIARFWENLQDGVESIATFSAEELTQSGLLDGLHDDPGFVNKGAVIEEIEYFDAAFFGISKREAEITDPQQRLFLECAWELMEHGGYNPDTFKGLIGVFGSVSMSYYFMNVMSSPKAIGSVGFLRAKLGNDKDFLAAWVAYKLNLKGAAYTIQTACSSSLVAVHVAAQSLLSGESDMALAGGIAVSPFQREGYVYRKGGILSPDGHCRAFDKDAQGTIGGNGCGLVLLKRLEDAVLAGDTIHAVIKGTAVNNDGSDKVGFTAPSIEGQARVVTEALEVADVSADTITYVEAHGTGTELGDPIELAALGQAYAPHTTRRGYCGIGSIKTNIGHLDVAAGIAGLIKTVLALEHKMMPPSLHYKEPNPKIDFANSPFYVNAALKDWPAHEEHPRRAGVSSFGLGGTNVHVILEEAAPAQIKGRHRSHHLLTLSARDAASLDRMTDNLQTFLQEAPDNTELADVAYTLQVGRRNFPERRTLVAADLTQARALLAGDRDKLPTNRITSVEPVVVFMFPGQGAQFVGMCAELYEQEPIFRKHIDDCADILEPLLGLDPLSFIFPEPGEEADAAAKLEQTQFTQPMLFVVSYALARLWRKWGIRPKAMIGHSVGEYVAATLAGVFSLQDALELLVARGKMVQSLPPGDMLSVPLAASAVDLGDDLSMAAVNGPNRCVVSGPREAVDRLAETLSSRGLAVRKLHTSHAFHSAMTEPILDMFEACVAQVERNAPKIPFISNLTGTWITDEQATDPAYWSQHLRGTVRFADGINALAEQGPDLFLEVGPRQTLCMLVRGILPRGSVSMLPSLPPKEGMPEEAVLQDTLGRLWTLGAPVAWDACHLRMRRHRIPLPTYPFDRKPYWLEIERGDTPAAPTAATAEPEVQAAPVQAAKAAEAAPKPATKTAKQAEPMDRKARTLHMLRDILRDLFGIEESDLDKDTTFFELGLDSLLLMQATRAIETQTGVEVAFQLLFDMYPNLDSLAAYLSDLVPESCLPQPEPEPEPEVDLIAPPTQTGGNEDLKWLVAEQLKIMNKQLELFGGAPQTPAKPSAAPKAAPTPAKPAAAEKTAKPVAFGPFQPPQNALEEITPRQRKSLDALIDRYTKRTAASKAKTEEYRDVLADPRASSGFRRLWKELMYRVIAERSSGSRIWDIDGNEYIDIASGFGVTLFGHKPKFIMDAVEAQLREDTALGPQSNLAGEVARLVCELTGNDRTMFTNSGTEAVMLALRMARAATNRDKIALFSGSFHGSFDGVLALSLVPGRPATPMAPGTTRGSVADMVVLDYGTDESLEIIRANAHEYAAILVEPLQSRRPEFLPRDFLFEVRDICDQTGTALIFDEVVSGFRFHPAGMQGILGLRADLVVYGKVVGGGMPIGMVSGKTKFMDTLDGGHWQFGDDSFPTVPQTFSSGTFNKHPIAMAASKAALLHLKAAGPALQETMAEKTTALAQRLNAFFEAEAVPMRVSHYGSLFKLAWTTGGKFQNLFDYYVMERGVHVWESGNRYLTTAHTQADIDYIVEAVKDSIRAMRADGFLDDPEDDTFSVPLTEGQKEIWRATRLDAEANSAYNETSMLAWTGTLDAAALERAFIKLVNRHDALRTRIAPDGESQIIEPKARVTFEHAQAEDDKAVERLVQSQKATPFDLENGPLFRTVLVKTNADRALLILTVHHIIIDAWSFGVIEQELSALYRAEMGGAPANLPKAMQFSDYVKRLVGTNLDQAADYWRNNLAGVEVLELPKDYPRPKVQSYEGGRYRILIDPTTTAALKRICADSKSTLFMGLLSTIHALIYRLSGSHDVVIAVPSTSQPLLGEPNLIGYCLSLLPIRGYPTPQKSFHQLMAEVKTTWLQAFRYQNFSMNQLLKALHIEPNAARHPLFTVSFNVDPDVGEISETQFGHVGEAPAKFDLVLNVNQGPDRMMLECVYTKIFDPGTIENWFNAYTHLLADLVQRPDTGLSQLGMIDEATRKQCVEVWNQTDQHYPQTTAHDLFETRLAQWPDRVALVDRDGPVTYTQLNDRADQIAGRLRALGVGEANVVAVFLERSAEQIATLIAIFKNGAVYLPLGLDYPVERLRFMAEDCGAKLLITNTSMRDKVDIPNLTTVLLDQDADPAPAPAPRGMGSPIHTATILFTSGSTGKPKGVVIPHRAIISIVCDTNYIQYHPEDCSAHISNSAFDGAIPEIWGPLLHGGRFAILEREQMLSSKALRKAIEDHQITIMFLTTMIFTRMSIEDPQIFSSLRILMFGGEVVSPKIVADFLAQSPPQLLAHVYGPTECTTFVTQHPITPADTQRGDIPIGKPIYHRSLYIFDESLNPVGPGVAGRIFVGGAGLGDGYLNRPALTAEKFVPHPFPKSPGERLYDTGDLGSFLPNGAVSFRTRVDSQVKLRGFRIEMEEISHRLNAHPKIKDACIRLVTSPEKRLVAWYAPHPDTTVDLSELRAWLKTVFPDFMIPSAFVKVEVLPVTPNGKLDYRALPKPDWSNLETSETYVAPRSTVEEELATIWSGVLKVNKVGIHDNFFELGGDSIMAIQITARAGRSGIPLTPKILLLNQTIAAITEALAHTSVQVVEAEQGQVSGPFPLTPIQAWFFDRPATRAHHFNQSMLLEADEADDPAALEQALAHLINHHDLLRACFPKSGPTILNDVGQVRLERLDLSDATNPHQAVTEQAGALQAGLDLEHGPLIRGAWITLGAQHKPLFLLVVHHLVVDGVSWRILLEDLQALYDTCKAGASPNLPPKTTDFITWADTLAKAAHSDHFREQVDYWLATPATPIPRDFDVAPEANTVASTQRVRVELNAEDTAALTQSLPVLYHTQIDNLLLTALLTAVSRWTQSTRATIDLEGHGRVDTFPQVDLSRTCGWFTVVYPLHLDTGGATDPRTVLSRVSEVLDRVPDHGLGYGLARFLGDDATKALPWSQSKAEISFNYLGRLDVILDEDALFAPSPFPAGDEHAGEDPRFHLLEIDGAIRGGRLGMSFAYSRHFHQQDTIQALADDFITALQALVQSAVEHGAAPLAHRDFDCFGWKHEHLERIQEIAANHQIVDIEDIYPLSPLQEGMLFHTLYTPHTGVYVTQITATMKGALHQDHFERAFNDLMTQHPILRTCFLWEGLDTPVQLVHTQPKLPLTWLDWRDHDPTGVQSELEDLIEEDRLAGLSTTVAPLMRITVVKLPDGGHGLIWSTHHILLDGWSMPIVFNQLLEAYAAACAGRPWSPAPVRPYRDYIEHLARQDQGAAEQFWRNHLAGFDEPTHIGPPAPANVEEPNFGVLEMLFPQDFCDDLRTYARQIKVTPNVLFQGAWAILISRYSGAHDVVFGTTSSGRPADLPGVESMVGLFINTLPIRVKINSNLDPAQFLAQLQASFIEARQYEYTPLQRIQNWAPIAKGQSLFESILGYENYPLEAPDQQAGGAEAQSKGLDLDIDELGTRERPHYPLNLMVLPGPQIGLRLFYDADRYGQTFSDRLFAHYENLLRGFLTQAKTIAALPMLDDKDHDRVRRLNATDMGYPADACFHHLFEARAAESPDATALVYGDQVLTYRDLNQKANQLALYLSAAGVTPESRVGLFLNPCSEMIISILAVFKAGACYVPMDPAYPEERLKTIRESAGLQLLLTAGEPAAAFAGADTAQDVRVMNLDTEAALIAEAPTENPGIIVHPDNLAYMIFTSGSTGRPKGVMLHHRGLCNLSENQMKRFQLTPADRILQFSSLSFDASIFEIVMGLRAGAALHLAPRRETLPGPGLVELLKTRRITQLTIPPSALAMTPHEELPDLRCINVAGEACPPELVARWAPTRVFHNLYGPTEATVWTTADHCEPDGDKPTIGLPVGNVRVHLLDADLNPVPYGTPGELCIAGISLARGYLGRPDLTAQSFVPNPCGAPGERLYRSGDLAAFRPDGRLQFHRRIDTQVKVRGFRIEIAEIETHLKTLDGVKEAVVIVRRHEHAGNFLAAYLVGPGTDQLPKIRGILTQRLPDYMVPTAWVSLDALPLTANGKLDTKKLPMPEGARPELSNEYVAPKTDIEKKIAAQWLAVLGIDRVGTRDNFFEIGGHSLLLVTLHSRLKTAFDRDFPMVKLLETPTIAGLAEFFSGKDDSAQTVEKIKDRAAKQKSARRARKRQIKRSN